MTGEQDERSGRDGQHDRQSGHDRERYRHGLPDHHDPTAGIGGAPPARSALTLRLILADIGLIAGILLAVWAATEDAPLVWIILPAVMAVTAAVDLLVVLRRKRRGEPG
ncbi:hypothetical protein GCM10023169_25470 [Georgenia halophila]|uniref:Uncharacterized protein n=1 Tax=Georgenia halophila TaxID=620889 RepID=A0ABP8LDW2_9MICO